MRYALRSILAATLVLALGCNVHQVSDGCLPQCDDDDEVFFADCVAFGGGPGACRPGNRRCCAIAAGCLGEVGDQVVESGTCPQDVVTVSECHPPCTWFPDAEIFWEDCLDGFFDDLCPPEDEPCCASAVGCIGPIGDSTLLVGDASCCATDADCGEDAYCAEDYDCRLGFDCDECESPRTCDLELGCLCRTREGDSVVDCPDGQVCGPDGVCALADPCEEVVCGSGETCAPFPTPDGFFTECLLFCFDDPFACGVETSCDGIRCRADSICTNDTECDEAAGRFCALDSSGMLGECTDCDFDAPDVCEGGNSDCDTQIDEDCETNLCGDTVREPPAEACDGDDLGGTLCSDLPGFTSGYLFCAGDCTFDTELCSTEICDNGVDDDSVPGADCEDPACFSDAAAGCCEPTFEPDVCDGYDGDCDFVVDEDCTAPVEDCLNGFDDDGDFLDDCDDPDCASLLGTSCGTDLGECTAGTYECGSSGEIECQGEVPPALEVCDGLDNDCDGVPDDPVDACMGGVFCSMPGSCDGSVCIYDSALATPCDDANVCIINTCTESGETCSDSPAGTSVPCGGEGFCNGAGECDFTG